MSEKDNHNSIPNSIPSKGDSGLKDPGRRQMLGVAAMAAAFTAGQVGSAEGQGKKNPPVNKPAPGPHGGLVPPFDVPGAPGYGPVSTFHDQSTQLVYKDGADYRLKVSAYAKRLRKKMNLPDGEFRHVVRLEPVKGPADTSDPCSCCCS